MSSPVSGKISFIFKYIRIFIAQFDPGSKNTWIFVGDYYDLDDISLYVTSLYFTTTTILTVGYGDISAQSVSEKLLCILLMLIGTLSFSFFTGSLSSIISNYDSSEAKLKEKISTLNAIQSEYSIELELYNKCVKTVHYDHSKKQKNFIDFLDELPHKIKLEMAMKIHDQMYNTIAFFKGKEKSFIAWIGHLLRPLNI